MQVPSYGLREFAHIANSGGFSASGRIQTRVLSPDRPIERREVDHVDLLQPKPLTGLKRMWFRAHGKLDDDPVTHQAVLAYASDYSLLESAFNAGQLAHLGNN